MSVYGLLASGSNEQLQVFHMTVCMQLNCIDRRGQTIRYTCMSEDLEAAKECAAHAGVTLEKIVRTEEAETYEMLVQGSHEGWAAKAKGA